ncbi:ATPase, T2SS/T4P/T4SS family [Treponema socranskii]|uniref:ATPase, T2SS/T4P/T4SS family n=1 Tax=Treponema socranskii TaxID=53419 RepID=UPI003D8BE0B8
MLDYKAQEIVNERQLQNLMGELYELTPYFKDESVLNIFTLRNGKIKIDHFTKGQFILDDIVFSRDKVMRIINFLAAMTDCIINPLEYPVLETFIPSYGFRVTAVIKPWELYPQLAIRRPNPRIITLEEYLEAGRISETHFRQIKEAIKEFKNIVIIGATGSGKTTFVNSCIHEQVQLYPTHRYLLIEDNPELRCEAEDVTHILIRHEQVQAARNFALRWCPKHITFGEIRNSIMAEGVLELWNTGHPGNFTTLHANSAKAGFERLTGMIQDPYVKNHIGEYVDLWVYLAHQKIEEVLESESIQNHMETLKQTISQMNLYGGLYDETHE